MDHLAGRRLLDGWDRLTLISQGAVDVVFDNGGAVLSSQSNQIRARSLRQRGARGILEGGRDKNELDAFTLENAACFVQIQAFGCHGNASQSSASPLQRLAQSGIHRVFHHHQFAGLDQGSDQQILCLLTTAGHQQIVRWPQSAGGAHLVSKIVPQGFVAQRGAQLQDSAQIGAGGDFGDCPAALLHGKELGCRPGCRKTNDSARGWRELGLNGYLRFDRCGDTGRPLYKTAAAHMTTNQPLAFEQLIGG